MDTFAKYYNCSYCFYNMYMLPCSRHERIGNNSNMHFEIAEMEDSGDIFSYFLGPVFVQALVYIPLAFILALTVISGLFEIIMYIRKSIENKCNL